MLSESETSPTIFCFLNAAEKENNQRFFAPLRMTGFSNRASPRPNYFAALLFKSATCACARCTIDLLPIPAASSCR